ncbi:MAG: hypothetical protein ACI97A_003818 [Planctomycetota bacterium]|jgi:hypothetical protein
MSNRARVLYLFDDYPQASQTYSRNEIRFVKRQMDVEVVALKHAKSPYIGAEPYRVMASQEAFVEHARNSSADLLHAHWLILTKHLFEAALATGKPFTIRGHSFDVLPLPGCEPKPRSLKKRFKKLKRNYNSRRLHGRRHDWCAPAYLHGIAPMINHSLCLGILTLPFARQSLEMAGIKPEKIVDTFPVIDFDLFHDRSPNGEGIMNAGISLPKKNMEGYIDLATATPDKNFDLYTIDDCVERLHEYNRAKGSPVNIVGQTPYKEMPGIYKQHQWLVYTASKAHGTAGWPLAIPEAQAAGVGVLMERLRPDLDQFIGQAGFLFDDVEEAQEIIKQPPSDAIREAGFEQAKKSDVARNIVSLFDLWRPVVSIDYEPPHDALLPDENRSLA